MSLMAFLCLHLCFLSSISPSQALKHEENPTVYEILQRYSFPIGLLPKGAVGYDLVNKTGRFTAFLGNKCSFSLEGSYQLRYQSTIKGYISEGKLRSLEGVSVKVLFLWLNIVEVTRSGDALDFSVGIASASFPISNFMERPQCGCGLDCVNGQVRMIGENPFVDSY
ncbi:hypothetical protein Sjap_007448 [Stephania japonica]|uniref:Uncharacterized protein n=1 Tax=Stephania japonica TaxID=461633 RepID=A0AAP0PBC1_9MAGN